MNIQLEEELIRIRIVRLDGRVDAFNSPALREHLGLLLENGAAHFVIDLREVTFLDSAALAVLVNTLKRARLAGGDVKLVWPKSAEARRIILLTKFDRVFDITDTVEAARREFGGAR